MMAMHPHSVVKTEYAFLAHPPPVKKPSKQPLYAETLPTQRNRHRSHNFSRIVTWASHVQPGSPASLSPLSPHCRPSLGKGCCSPIAPIRATSASFLHLTPTSTTVHVTTPSIRDFKADLTTVGYTSIFLQLPNTPISATLSFIHPPSSNIATNFPNTPSRKPNSLTRFRSLSVLRSRGRHKSTTPGSPTKMKAKDAAASAATVKHKKSKYSMRPPPLANELALMQFADGGSMDDSIKRVMETQAKAAGTVGRGDVYRNGEGGVWLDQDEELEYTRLLVDSDDSRLRQSDDERRESTSTQSSGLNPDRMVQPIDLLGGDDPALFGNTLASPIIRMPSSSVLVIPSRPNRVAKHLQNPTFLVDVVPRLPASPSSLPEPLNRSGADVKLKEKERRRPAPLNLSPPCPASKFPVNLSVESSRRDFIQSRFDSTLGSASVAPVAASDPGQPDMHTRLIGNSGAFNMPQQTRTAGDGPTSLGTKTKQSILNMKGLFRSGRK